METVSTVSENCIFDGLQALRCGRWVNQLAKDGCHVSIAAARSENVNVPNTHTLRFPCVRVTTSIACSVDTFAAFIAAPHNTASYEPDVLFQEIVDVDQNGDATVVHTGYGSVGRDYVTVNRSRLIPLSEGTQRNPLLAQLNGSPSSLVFVFASRSVVDKRVPHQAHFKRGWTELSAFVACDRGEVDRMHIDVSYVHSFEGNAAHFEGLAQYDFCISHCVKLAKVRELCEALQRMVLGKVLSLKKWSGQSDDSDREERGEFHERQRKRRGGCRPANKSYFGSSSSSSSRGGSVEGSSAEETVLQNTPLQQLQQRCYADSTPQILATAPSPTLSSLATTPTRAAHPDRNLFREQPLFSATPFALMSTAQRMILAPLILLHRSATWRPRCTIDECFVEEASVPFMLHKASRVSTRIACRLPTLKAVLEDLTFAWQYDVGLASFMVLASDSADADSVGDGAVQSRRYQVAQKRDHAKNGTVPLQPTRQCELRTVSAIVELNSEETQREGIPNAGETTYIHSAVDWMGGGDGVDKVPPNSEVIRATVHCMGFVASAERDLEGPVQLSHLVCLEFPTPVMGRSTVCQSSVDFEAMWAPEMECARLSKIRKLCEARERARKNPEAIESAPCVHRYGADAEEEFYDEVDAVNNRDGVRTHVDGAGAPPEIEDSVVYNRDGDGLIASTISAYDDSYCSNVEFGDLATDPEYVSADDTTGIASPAIPASAIQRLYMNSSVSSAEESSADAREILSPDDGETDFDEVSSVESNARISDCARAPPEHNEPRIPEPFHRTDAAFRMMATPNATVPAAVHAREVLVAEDDSDDDVADGLVPACPNDEDLGDGSVHGSPPPTIVGELKRNGRIPVTEDKPELKPHVLKSKSPPLHVVSRDTKQTTVPAQQVLPEVLPRFTGLVYGDRRRRKNTGFVSKPVEEDVHRGVTTLDAETHPRTLEIEGREPRALRTCGETAGSENEDVVARTAAQQRRVRQDAHRRRSDEQVASRKGPSPPLRAASRYAIQPGKRHLHVVVDRCTELPGIRHVKGKEDTQQLPVVFITVETSVDKERTRDVSMVGPEAEFRDEIVVEIGGDVSNERVTVTAVAVVPGVGVRRLGTCVLSLNILPVNEERREINVPLVHNAGHDSARERGRIYLTLYSSNFGNASAPPEAVQEGLRTKLRPLLLRNAREELHRLEWYVGEYCERLTDIPALFERFGETAALEVHQGNTMNTGSKVQRVLTVTVNDVRTLTSRKGVPSQCDSCYVVVRSSDGTVQTKVIPYRRVATFDETFTFRIARPSRECLDVSVFSSAHKFGECVVSTRALQRDTPLQKTHMIINAAGTPQAMPCGFVSLTLRSAEFGRRRRFNAAKDEAVRTRIKNYMWKYAPEELHKLDVVVSNVGDVEAFMKTMVSQYGEEPPAQKIEITLSRCDDVCGVWDGETTAAAELLGETPLTASAMSARRSRVPLQHSPSVQGSRGGVDSVPYASPDVAAANVGSIIAQSIHGGGGAAVGGATITCRQGAHRLSSSTLKTPSASLSTSPSVLRLPTLYVVVRCGLEQYQTRSVRSTPEGNATFNETCSLHVSDPAKDEVLVIVMCEESKHDTEICRMVFSMRTLLADKPSTLHAQLVSRSHTKLAQFHGTVDARFTPHGFGLTQAARTPEAEVKFRTDLTKLLYHNVPEQLHRLEYLIGYYIDRETTIVDKLIAEHGGGVCEPSAVVVRVLGIRHWAVTGKTYIKGYLDGVPFLRTSDSHGKYDLAFTAESKNTGTSVLQDPQRSVVRFKIAQHKFFQSVPLAYAEISVRNLQPNMPNVWWVPLFSVSTGAALGTLGVDLQSSAFVGKRKEYAEAVSTEGVIHDITTLVCKFNPRLAYRVQPLISQAPSIRDAHSELRRKLAPWPIAATVYLKVERIDMVREEDKEPVLRGNISAILTFGGETMRSTLQKDTNPLSVAPNMLQMPLFRLDIPEQRIQTTTATGVDGQHALELIVNECVHPPHGAAGNGAGRRHGGGAFASGAAALAHMQLPREKEIGRALISLRALLTPELFASGESVTVPIVYTRRNKSSQGQSALDSWRSNEAYVAGEVTLCAMMPTFEHAPRWLHFDPEKMQRIDRAFIQHYRRRIAAFLSTYHPESLVDFTYKLYERDVASGQWPLSLPDWLVSLVKRFGPEKEIFSPPPELVFDAEREHRDAVLGRTRQSRVKHTPLTQAAPELQRAEQSSSANDTHATRHRCKERTTAGLNGQLRVRDDDPGEDGICAVDERTRLRLARRGFMSRDAVRESAPVDAGAAGLPRTTRGNVAVSGPSVDVPRAPDDTNMSGYDDDNTGHENLRVDASEHYALPNQVPRHRRLKRSPARRRTRTYGGTTRTRAVVRHHAADDMTMFFRKRPLDY